MSNINSYLLLNKTASSVITFFKTISLIITIALAFILNMQYTKYYNTFGQVIYEINNYKLLIYIEADKLELLKNNNPLYINSKEYSYTISHIDNQYTPLNNKLYQSIVIDINLPSEDKIINNTINIKIYDKNQKLFYYIKERMKK